MASAYITEDTGLTAWQCDIPGWIAHCDATAFAKQVTSQSSREDTPMGSHHRVIIIGGGIVGLSTLYHLAKAGEPEPLLLERRELAAGATWHAAGNVHTQSAYANLSALQAYSIRLYDSLGTEVGQDVGSHIVGGFFLAQTQERMEEFRRLAGKFRTLGIEYELVTPDEIRTKHPLVRVDDLYGGAWDPDEGYVDPYSVAMGLASGARRLGGRIYRNARVERIERLSSGYWRLVAGERTLECEVVVNCAGFWANKVARLVDARVPITNMEHQYLETEAIPEVAGYQGRLPMIRDTDSQYYLRQEGPGLLVGPWERGCRAAWNGADAPWSFGEELFPEDLERLSDGLAAAVHRVPALERAGIRRTVNGAISFSPDGRPIVGPLPGIPNYFVACGFLGGIAQGGGVGLALSEWIRRGEPELCLHCIDVARFGSWTTGDFARERIYEIYPLRYEISHPGLERKSGRNLRMAPIHQELLLHGAVMGQANGWERPLWFAPAGVEPVEVPNFRRPNWWNHVGDEARAIASGCGLTEMSSYAKFRVSGPGAQGFLERVCSAPVPMVDNRIVLTLLLNNRGGILGDITVHREGDSFHIVGATMARIFIHRWLLANVHDHCVDIEDVTDAYAALGLAGPRSRDILNELSGGAFSRFPFLSARRVEVANVHVRALRVSYSGELGWELYCRRDRQEHLFHALMGISERHGLVLTGSRAMGMLRLEKGYRSWNSELTTEITPHAAGLERFCARHKEYVGSQTVDHERRHPPQRKLATLELDTEAPPCWGDEPVFADARLVGQVTSGGMGWRTGKMLAVGLIESAESEPGRNLEVEILHERFAATVLRDPVYDPSGARLRE